MSVRSQRRSPTTCLPAPHIAFDDRECDRKAELVWCEGSCEYNPLREVILGLVSRSMTLIVIY